jgi:multimeric flavodoxin WrbA
MQSFINRGKLRSGEMKVIGIVGSPRKNGNTELLTKHTLKAISEEGLDTELIRLAGLEIRPCTACMACKKQEACSIEDDLFPIYLKMREADGIILASPVYYGSATALIKALMERVGYIARWNGEPFHGKVGGPLVVARRSGKNFTIAQLTLWFQILGFFIPGSTYWNVAVGRGKGEVEQDEEGLETVWNFGKNVAFLIKKLST